MTLRIGVVGTGAIGRDHIERLTGKIAGAEVVAVADVDRARAEAVAAGLVSSPKVHETGRSLILDPDVEAVLVASSGPSHEDLVLAAIAAVKPVFCEKPLATTQAAALRIVAAEVAAGRPLVQVGFMRRYDRGYRALKAVLESGGIGAVLMVHCTHRNADVPPSYGGTMPLTDSLVHEIDVLRWLLADDYRFAQVVLPRRSRHARADFDDPHLVLLETTAGIRIDVEIFVQCQYGYDIRCEIVGEEGTATLPEPLAVPLRRQGQAGSAVLADWKPRFAEAYDIELQAWVDAMKDRGLRGPTAWDGYCACVTADACVAAKARGEIVPIVMAERPGFYDRR